MDYKLFDLVFQSADAMMRKLYKKHLDGLRGWDKDAVISEDQLIAKLHRNLDKKDWIDVMALAAILTYRALESPQPVIEADAEKQPACACGVHQSDKYCGNCGLPIRTA
uniref:Uncharacterized protein n=1 Tax=viral metagenome TaxID=1070528 RepID=A0A6M3JW59_9ZZZZ